MDLQPGGIGIERYVETLLDDADAPGATIALMVDGQLWSTGIGRVTRDRLERLDAEARFSTYSVTKIVIATIVMKLAETGALSLDDPIGGHLPKPPGVLVDTPVAIRQLLNHTGGVPDYGGNPDYHEAVRSHPEAPWTSDEFLEKSLAQGLLFEPGGGWRYSNIGYMLLRQMIERVTGGSLRQAVRHYLSISLALPDLEVVETLEDVAALTPGHSRMLDSDGPVVNVIPRYHPGWVSHGLVASTAGDLAQFLDDLFSGGVVRSETLREMVVPVSVQESHPWMREPSYGLGLMIDPGNRFGVVAGHSGGGPGYSTAAYHFPDVAGHRVTSVALVNRDGGDIATNIAFSVVARIADNLRGHSHPYHPSSC